MANAANAANADVCNIAPCITSVKSNTGIITECEGKAPKESCFITNDLNKQFYHSVGDKFNTYAIKALFESIANELTTNYDDEIRSLFDIAKTVSSAVKFKFLDNDNHRKCDDIVGVFYLEKAGKGGTAPTKNIFHISLHSEMPKYIRDARRSISACGFYEKGEKNTENEGPGAFHYKIENIFWSPSDSQLREAEQPWKRLNINRSTPSMFIHNTANFDLSYDFFRRKYKSTQISDEDLETKIKDGNTLHKKIYNMFVERWNKYVIRDSLESSVIKLFVKGHISASKSKSRSRSRSRSRSPSRGGRRTRSNRKNGKGRRSSVKTRKSRR